MSRSRNLPEGVVLVTDEQTAGRGWGAGAQWVTEPGQNLTFSVLLKPCFLPAERCFALNAALALGIHHFLQARFGARAAIKWPNDALIDRRKVCGMLIENQIRGGYFVQSVVGIGLNVNQMYFPFPSASSLRALAGGEPIDLSQALGDMLTALEASYCALRDGALDRLEEEYTAALFGVGQRHVFQLDDQTLKATLRGVDRMGRLIIETEDGAMPRFDAKAIKLLL